MHFYKLTERGVHNVVTQEPVGEATRKPFVFDARYPSGRRSVEMDTF
jgi:hypothetical protein